MQLISVIRSLTAAPIQFVSEKELSLIAPSIFERVKIPRRSFLRQCQFGIVNPLIVLRDGKVLDGNRRLMACKVWSQETVPVKIITDELSRDNQIRLAVFLNSHRKRLLAFNVGDGEKYEDPIPTSPDDLESRLVHARKIIDLRISDDIAFSKIVSQRRAEFSADYEDCVESALQTARSLKAFCSLWDDEPPLPLAAAAKLSRESVFQLSLLQNSGRRDVLKK